MQFHNALCESQSDSQSGRLRGEMRLENTVPNAFLHPRTIIGHRDLAFSIGNRNRGPNQTAALAAQRLNRVIDQIEQPLFNQPPVGVDDHRAGGFFQFQFHLRLCGRRPDNLQHRSGKLAGIEFTNIQLQRTVEIEESPNHTIQPLHFAADKIQLGFSFGNFVHNPHTQRFKAQRNGVQRVLDFVRNATRQAADGAPHLVGIAARTLHLLCQAGSVCIPRPQSHDHRGLPLA